MFFCKEKCEEGNVLIETTDVRAQSGRYSLEYEEGFYPKSSTILYVSISQLTKSDSGRYRCGLERTVLTDEFSEFEIRVSDGEFLSYENILTEENCNCLLTADDVSHNLNIQYLV